MRNLLMIFLAALCLTGCSVFRIEVPGQDAAGCIALPPLSMARRHAAAQELAALTARDPDAVLPGLIRDYLTTRARAKAACPPAKAE